MVWVSISLKWNDMHLLWNGFFKKKEEEEENLTLWNFTNFMN